MPVDQVRETCAQALGALLTHLPGDLVEKVLDELLALCGHAEVCVSPAWVLFRSRPYACSLWACT